MSLSVELQEENVKASRRNTTDRQSRGRQWLLRGSIAACVRVDDGQWRIKPISEDKRDEDGDERRHFRVVWEIRSCRRLTSNTERRFFSWAHRGSRSEFNPSPTRLKSTLAKHQVCVCSRVVSVDLWPSCCVSQTRMDLFFYPKSPGGKYVQ